MAGPSQHLPKPSSGTWQCGSVSITDGRKGFDDESNWTWDLGEGVLARDAATFLRFVDDFPIRSLVLARVLQSDHEIYRWPGREMIGERCRHLQEVVAARAIAKLCERASTGDGLAARLLVNLNRGAELVRLQATSALDFSYDPVGFQLASLKGLTSLVELNLTATRVGYCEKALWDLCGHRPRRARTFGGGWAAARALDATKSGSLGDRRRKGRARPCRAHAALGE